MTNSILIQGSALERAVIEDAWRRLRQCQRLQETLAKFDDLGIHLAISIRHGQNEDALLTWEGNAPEVQLASHFMNAERPRLPAVLAHEILGHAIWEGRAREQGVFAAVHFHHCNELNSRMLGWMATLELGPSPVDSGLFLEFCRDPDRFAETLPYLSPHYVLLMSGPEMRDAHSTLQARLNALTDEWIHLPTDGTFENRAAQLVEMIRTVSGTLARMDEQASNKGDAHWFAAHADCELVRELEYATWRRDAELRRCLDLPVQD